MITIFFFFYRFTVFWMFCVSGYSYYILINNRIFTRIASFFISRQFLSKRKVNLEIPFFISDPNTLVYANYYTFRIFFFFFLSIWSFRYNTLFIYSFRTFKEIVNYLKRGIYVFCIFIWSFIFMDIDLSRSFLFDFKNESWINNSWDFANYFHQFRGLFFDAFFCCIFFSVAYFVYFWKNIFGFYKNTFNWIFRICLYITIFYFFSDESFKFDFRSFFIVRSFFELFLFFGNLFKWIKAYKQKMLI
jgi:hypothetical protein